MATAQHVLFGERTNAGYTRGIYFDAHGYIYPDFLITDDELGTCGSLLETWYQKHPEKFLEIAKIYGCSFAEYNAGNVEILNDSILSKNIQRIDQMRKDHHRIHFLVHGFRKPFKETYGGRPSPHDFDEMKSLIDAGSRPGNAYVEIYWDGMYGCCFSAKAKKNKELFKLFEEAQENAVYVGKSLRTVMAGVGFDTIFVYSHSLGAKVVTTALFNVSACEAATPVNKNVRICLIAPAIPGTDTFEYYYCRPGMDTLRNKDSYKLAIIYNENDFVLKKKDSALGILGPGPYRYGDTSLGCNHHNSVRKVLDMFKERYRFSPIKAFNFEEVGKCHHVYCYCRNEKFRSVLEYLDD